METAWLRCKVLPGMFSSERLVLVLSPSGDELLTILVDEQTVQSNEAPREDHPVDGFLRVVHATSSAARATVTLPVSTGELGRVVSVPLELLSQH